MGELEDRMWGGGVSEARLSWGSEEGQVGRWGELEIRGGAGEEAG